MVKFLVLLDKGSKRGETGMIVGVKRHESGQIYLDKRVLNYYSIIIISYIAVR